MSDQTPNNDPTPDASAEAQTTPIEIPASDSSQAERAQADSAAAATSTARQGVPAWAVISGAAAVGLIIVAGLGGYAIGQANANPIRDLPILEAGSPMQPGGPMGEGDDGDSRGEGRGYRDGRDGHDGRGDHRGEWRHDDGEKQWEQDDPRDRMRPQDDFGMPGPIQGPMQGPMQGISPEDLQQLLDLLMQSSDGRMPFDGQWGGSHGYSQGS